MRSVEGRKVDLEVVCSGADLTDFVARHGYILAMKRAFLGGPFLFFLLFLPISPFFPDFLDFSTKIRKKHYRNKGKPEHFHSIHKFAHPVLRQHPDRWRISICIEFLKEIMQKTYRFWTSLPEAHLY